MSEPTCHLLRLSTELILQIMDYSPPSAYLDMALTCTTLHRQCKNLLDLHRDAHAKYRIVSDLSPETVIDLLKDNTKASIERWHVRELEIWGSREGWQDWRPWAPKLPGTCCFAEGFPTRPELDLRDMQRYIQTGQELWSFSDDDSDEIRRNLESGQDAFLKLLLITSCPRLHSLRFVKRGLDPHTTLKCFESLRSIAVGIETDQRSWNDENVHRDGRDFAALLYIPNLESLYFNDLHYDRDEEDDEDFDMIDQYDFPYRTSSVKHLFIDGASSFSTEFYQNIAGVAQGLESVVLRVGTEYGRDLDDVDAFVGYLATENATTLQKLIIYNPDGMHGYRCTNYRPEELDRFDNKLRLFTMAASDIELDGLYQLEGENPNAEKLAEYVSEAFPASTEAIYIWGRSDEHVDDSKPNGIPSDTLDSALASLIESGVYENLEVIYLTDVEKRHAQDDRETALGRPIDAGLKKLILQKSVAAGRKTGVHVCTLMDREDGAYWKNFPAKPDRFDLKTGPCGERPTSWRLNLQSGEWGPDCEGCGECKDCLVVYPAELWKSGRSLEG